MNRYKGKRKLVLNVENPDILYNKHFKSINSTTQNDYIGKFTKVSSTDNFNNSKIIDDFNKPKIKCQGLNILLRKNLCEIFQQNRIDKKTTGRQHKFLKTESSQVVLKSEDIFKKFSNDEEKDRKTIMMKFNVSHSDLFLDQYKI